MPLSKYLKLYPSPDSPDSLIAYSTQNASAALIPSEIIEDIGKSTFSPDDAETLADLGLVVENSETEKQKMQGFIQELNELDTSFKYVVVLNLDCNLACTYCFEGKRKGKYFLSDETASQFVDFVKKREFSGKDTIKIVFYGGEPLLSVERIVSVSEKIQTFAQERGVKYSFMLVTNGTLLTPGVVERLKPLGLQGAKVTLDGPKDIHDRYRPLRSGTGSFNTILRNIRDVCDRTAVQIGGNYTRQHFREFPRLLDDLSAAGLAPDKISFVKFDPVMNESNEFAPPDFHDGCESTGEPWISEASIFLREEILRRGYRTPKIMPSPCFAEFRDSLVVNYDGSLYKCPGLIGRQQYCVGDLVQGAGEYRQSHGLDVWKNDTCLECAYLPLCFGGCTYVKAMRDGSLQGIQCQKEYFDRTLGALVAQDITYDL